MNTIKKAGKRLQGSFSSRSNGPQPTISPRENSSVTSPVPDIGPLNVGSPIAAPLQDGSGRTSSSGSQSPSSSPYISTAAEFQSQQETSTQCETISAPLNSREGRPQQSADPTKPTRSTLEASKDYARVASNLTQMLLKKAPAAVDTNPAKIVFGLAKIVLEIKEGIKDNIDAVDRRIVETSTQLIEVQRVLTNWTAGSAAETRGILDFQMALTDELQKLQQLEDQSRFRQFAVHEDNKKQIAEIFERINEARVRLGLSTNLRVFNMVYAVNETTRQMLLNQLEASNIADHKYHLEGKEERILRRAVCTPGTRERILDNITQWARGSSSRKETVYWLFGPAGSGKSTIAYTIARRFELAGKADRAALGGNFFCSRQFEETKHTKWIVRTIVYHLALVCKPFADALVRCGRFDTIHRDAHTQLKNLLVTPWHECEAERLADPSLPPYYLIVVDALDEINGKGGSAFLRDILDIITTHRLQGLKFFATSRSDPDLVNHLQKFKDKQLYHLHEVPAKEAHDDITKYLNANLPHFVGSPEIDFLVTQAAGLFIHAATIVKYLANSTVVEQRRLLSNLASSPSGVPQTDADETPLLDQLYHQLLVHAFCDVPSTLRPDRLKVLHTFLCTAERTSTSTVAGLALESESCTSVVDAVLARLHAVLYIKDDKVLWYHKSFPDFIFDNNRSKEFWCDQGELHRCLTESTFKIMKTGLRFNIADIPSSYVFDRDNHTLSTKIRQNISTLLCYSCRYWGYHLFAAATNNPAALCGMLSEFLELRALFWIEAMNLLGLRGLCDPMFTKASGWIVKHNSAVAAELAEAADFAAYFSGCQASLSTPHLYLSALASWPQKLEPCQRWRQHFPCIPGFSNSSQDGTPVLTITLKHEVYSAAFSPDDRRIVSGSQDKLVRVFDSSTGEVLNVLEGHTNGVFSVAFSTDGAHIVSGSGDKSVRVWNSLTGDIINVLEGHTDGVSSVAFSSNGAHVVSGSYDKSVRVWDAFTGLVLHVLKDHTDFVRSVAFSTSGTCIISGSGIARPSPSPNDKTVRVWDSLTGKLLSVLEGHTSPVTSVKFSTDGRRIVSGSHDKSVRVWDASQGTVLYLLHAEAPVASVAFSTDGRYIASGSQNAVRVWESQTGRLVNVLTNSFSISSVAFSSDGRRIVSASYKNSVQVWAVLSNPTGKALKGISMEDIIIDVSALAFSHDNMRIASVSRNSSVWVWNSLTGEVLLRGRINFTVHAIAFSTDGSCIVSGSRDGSVRVWHLLTGEVLEVLHVKESVSSVAFSTNGSCIALGSKNGSVWVWDSSTRDVRVLQMFQGPNERQIISVAFSPDDTRIISGSYNGLKTWDSLTGEVLTAFEGFYSYPDGVTGITRTAIAFSTDGSCIVSGLQDGSVLVSDTSTGETLNVFKGHTRPVSTVAFSPDATRILSASQDGSVRVWYRYSSKSTSAVWTPRYIRETVAGKPEEYTGWLLSPQGERLLMFVPLHEQLPDDTNILTIPRTLVPYVDFSGSALGSRWDQCYSP